MSFADVCGELIQSTRLSCKTLLALNFTTTTHILFCETMYILKHILDQSLNHALNVWDTSNSRSENDTSGSFSLVSVFHYTHVSWNKSHNLKFKM